MQSLSTATTIYMAQYAGNLEAAIYDPCANGLLIVAVLFIVVVGLLFLFGIL